jgi:hypothetical protein
MVEYIIRHSEVEKFRVGQVTNRVKLRRWAKQKRYVIEREKDRYRILDINLKTIIEAQVC